MELEKGREFFDLANEGMKKVTPQNCAIGMLLAITVGGIVQAFSVAIKSIK